MKLSTIASPTPQPSRHPLRWPRPRPCACYCVIMPQRLCADRWPQSSQTPSQRWPGLFYRGILRMDTGEWSDVFVVDDISSALPSMLSSCTVTEHDIDGLSEPYSCCCTVSDLCCRADVGSEIKLPRPAPPVGTAGSGACRRAVPKGILPYAGGGVGTCSGCVNGHWAN